MREALRSYEGETQPLRSFYVRTNTISNSLDKASAIELTGEDAR
jgi:hypothetical protein